MRAELSNNLSANAPRGHEKKKMNIAEVFMKVLVLTVLLWYFVRNLNVLVRAAAGCAQVQLAAIFLSKGCFLSYLIEHKNTVTYPISASMFHCKQDQKAFVAS